MEGFKMSKKTQLSIKIDSDLKKSVEIILDELGLTPSQAIKIFFRQVALQNGLPFIVKIPNQQTVDAYSESRIHENLASFNSTNELFVDLGI